MQKGSAICCTSSTHVIGHNTSIRNSMYSTMAYVECRNPKLFGSFSFTKQKRITCANNNAVMVIVVTRRTAGMVDVFCPIAAAVVSQTQVRDDMKKIQVTEI